MKGFLKNIAVLLLYAANLLITIPAWAQHSGGCACGKPATLPLIFELDVVQGFRDDVLSELRRWDNYASVFTQFREGDGVGGRNGKHEIIAFFSSNQVFEIWGFNIDPITLGITFLNPPLAFGLPPFDACPPPDGTLCGFFQEVDVVIANAPIRGWTTALPNLNGTGPNYFNATVLHELGHALGLHHNFNNHSTMNYTESFAQRYITRADTQILRLPYPELAKTVTDIATYPFHYAGFQAGGTIVASPDRNTVRQGEQFALRNFSVENIGTTTLSNVRLHIYLTEDQAVSSNDHLVGTLSWDSFGTFFDATSVTLEVPDDVPPGTYFIGAIIFHNTNQQDSISYNNAWVLDASRQITVTAALPDGGGNNSGALENPGEGSFKSGLGIISGWVCEANRVEVEVDGVSLGEAAYGTSREDTRSICGDANNGFGLLWNWNLVGSGTHTIRVFADGGEFASANFRVTTFGVEFLSGVSGQYLLLDFPQTGTNTLIEWEQSSQNFVIRTDSSSPAGGQGSARGSLENPSGGSFKSGLGIISGWVCEANRVEVEVDGVSLGEAAYGTSREDTRSICGDANNGFGLLWNWNLVGSGTHTIRVFADGGEFASANFRVTTFGVEFLSGVSGQYLLLDFPQTGTNTLIEWEQSSQNFVITGVE